MVLTSGCTARYAVVPQPPLQTASLAELMTRLDHRTQSIETLKALLSIRAEGQPSVTASLFFSRSAGGGPPSLRLKGFDTFGRTLFDLISSNNRVLLSIPPEGRVVEIGPGEGSPPSMSGEMGLEAAELRQAVSALVGPFMESGEIPVLENIGTNYLVHLIHISGASGELTKRLWFERTNLRLIREEIFETGTESAGPTVVEFLDYRSWPVPAGAEIDWPDRVIVTRPRIGDGEPDRLQLDFREIRPNATISPEEYRIP